MATKSAQKKTLVLLDAHAILHRAYHALPDFTSPKGEPTGALYGVVAMLLKIIEELKPDYIAACFDLPEPTYRHEVYEAYKAGRTETEESLVAQIERSRDIFEAFGIRIFEHPGFEADDILGTIAKQTKKLKGLNVIIASGDMDTLQLVDGTRVRVYTLRKGIKDTVMYDEKGVKKRFGFGPALVPDYKGLRGDPSDNIPGIQGVGEKTATELITKFGGIDALYKTLKKDESKFKKEGIKDRITTLLKENEEEAEFSKMLATIRCDAPVTFTLPKKTWREQLNVEAILTLFGELGFRTLSGRVKTLFGEGEGVVYEGVEKINEQELEETTIALWLLESDTTNPTLDDVLSYGLSKGNAHTFAASKKLIFDELEKRGLTTLFTDIEKPLIAILKEMKARGIKVDTAHLRTLSTNMHKELATLEQKIYKHAGTEFNINSPKQLADVLYDTLALKPKHQKRTATGQRTTKESELEKLKDQHHIIKEILRYREVQKLLSTYIDTIPELVGKDGRLHSTFLQAGTTTGRMASKDPNIQNIPIRTKEGREIRKAFVAEKGSVLVAIDYSQIELRIAAILSKDQKLVEIFKNGEDVHKGVASRVFGVSPEEVTAEMRRKAKVINFGILYGMGVNALRTNLGEETTRGEAQEFLNAYFSTFTRLAEYLEETKEYARKNGYTETLYGRRRHFPGITSSVPFIRASAERMAINAPIQGTEGDIVRVAMVRVAKLLDKKEYKSKAHMLLQVHDELVFEIQEKSADTLIPKLVAIMEEVLTKNETGDVPIIAEAKMGKNWEEMERVNSKK